MIHLVSELVGVAGAAAVAVYVGRTRLLREWHGPAPVVPRRPWLFWPVAAALGVVSAAVAAALPRNDLVNVAGARALTAVTVAMVGAAAVARLCDPGHTKLWSARLLVSLT